MTNYIVKMIGYDIPIDEEEIPKIIAGVAKGSILVLKQGIINPSGFSGIIEDKNRLQEKEVDIAGHYTGKLISRPLRDLFPNLRNDIDLLSNQKRLNEKY